MILRQQARANAVARADPIIALGLIVEDELYGRAVPIVCPDLAAHEAIRDGDVGIAPTGPSRAAPGRGDAAGRGAPWNDHWQTGMHEGASP